MPTVATRETREEAVQVLTVRMPQEVHGALRTMAFATDKSMNELALSAFREFLGAQAHRETVEGLLSKIQDQYRVALDKLADL